MDLTVEQRINIVQWFYVARDGRTENGAILIVQDKFRHNYNRGPPNRRAILKIVTKFETIGEVTNQYKKAGRPNTIVNLHRLFHS
jgi:hypothetical protein